MKSIVEPLVKFLRATMSGSSLLFISTVAALIWANSDYAAGYFELWQTTIGIRIGAFELSNSLHHWINDALMAVFFFVVGLEIKREFLVGELASFRLAVFPMIAALGGMVVPALIYLGFNWNGPGEAGWGIPMASARFWSSPFFTPRKSVSPRF